MVDLAVPLFVEIRPQVDVEVEPLDFQDASEDVGS